MGESGAGGTAGLSNLAVDAARVYVHARTSSKATVLLAFDRHTGKQLWQRPSAGVAAPTVANGVVFVAEGADGVGAYRASTGAELWRAKGIADGNDPIVGNGRLVVGLRPAADPTGPAALTMFGLD